MDRERSHEAVSCAMDDAMRDCRTSRERRFAEHEAVLTMLERLELNTRIPGRAPNPATESEGTT